MRIPARLHQAAFDQAIHLLRRGRPGESGYGRRIAVLLTIPTFDDPVARDVRRASTGALYVVRTVWLRGLDLAASSLVADARFTGARLPMAMLSARVGQQPSLASTRIDLDARQLEPLIERVTSATIPCRPRAADAPLDSTIHELTFGDELDETRFRWSAAAPPGWEPLAAFASELVRLVDTPVASAAP